MVLTTISMRSSAEWPTPSNNPTGDKPTDSSMVSTLVLVTLPEKTVVKAAASG
jgi:hypothetical protein